MKVLHVIGGISRETGGPSRSCQGLVAAECNAGIDAWLWPINGGEPWIEGVRLFDCSDCSIVRLKQFDLIHIHGIWSWKLHRVAVMCRKAGVPYVLAPRGTLAPWALKYKWLKKKIARIVYQDKDLRLAAALHATAESEAEQIKRLGFKNKIIISPNGVNVLEREMFECSNVRNVRMDGQRRRLAERKVEEWMEGVTEESFRVALEKLVAEKSQAGEYRFERQEDMKKAISAAKVFFDVYSRKLVELSDGRCVYFAPDPRSKMRYSDISTCWAEYAFHAVSSGGDKIPGKNYNYRKYSEYKVVNTDLIEGTLKSERCVPVLKDKPSQDSVKFFGSAHLGGLFDVVVRLDECGNANANMTEVTFEASTKRRQKKPPQLVSLAEAIRTVVSHQTATGTYPSDANILPNHSPLRKGGGRRALFVSRMHPVKGVLELVESWARVRPKAWVCELVYTMNSDEERAYEQKVKRRVHELGLDDQFVFTGPLDDDAKWFAYARADLFVLPTYSENFGIVVAEALWAGVPVITTKGTPWAELECSASSKFQVSSSRLEERCGWWIDLPPEDAKIKGDVPEWTALDSAIREAIEQSRDTSNRKMLQSMGQRGRQLIGEKYTWSAAVRTLASEYGTIISKEGR